MFHYVHRSLSRSQQRFPTARRLLNRGTSSRFLARVITLIAGLVFISVEGYAQGVQCEQPNALIILDRSGSMSDDGKWETAVNAINDLTLAYDSAVRFGLSYFPSSGRCGTGNNLLQGVAPNNGGNIRGELQRLGNPRGQGATPIAGALGRGLDYLRDLNDVDRNNIIILITDGDQTCNGDGNPVNRAQAAFQSGFPVYVISFGRGATDTRTLRDMAREGGTNDYYQADNADGLIQSLIDIVQLATTEGCDGQDNDCDGRIDEGIPPQPCETNCGLGEKICIDGQLSICTGGEIPPDICDGNDNDCDGLIDEVGYGECITPSGNPGTAMCLEGGVIDEDCVPDDESREEVCDGRDNNENGEIDENTDEECSVECHLGRRRCVEGVLLNCSAPPVGPERCNGYDDDCDGLIDEMAMCVGDEVCGDTGECLVPCTNGECFGDFICDSNNLCVRRPCPTPCAEGQRCVAQACITPCVVDSQCGETEICNSEERRCVPDDRTSGSITGGMMAGAEAGDMSAGSSAGTGVGGTQTGGTTNPAGESTAGFLVEPPPATPGGTEAASASAESGASCQARHQRTDSWLGLLLIVFLIRRRHYA